jgi:hypothetical protein
VEEKQQEAKEYTSPRQLALQRKQAEASNPPAIAGSLRSRRGTEFTTPQNKSGLDFQSLRSSLRRTRPAPAPKPDVFDAPPLQRRHTLTVSPRRASLQRKQAEPSVSILDIRGARAKLRPKKAPASGAHPQIAKPLPPLPESPREPQAPAMLPFSPGRARASCTMTPDPSSLAQRSTGRPAPLSAAKMWTLPAPTESSSDSDSDPELEGRCLTPTPSTVRSTPSTPPSRGTRPSTPRPRVYPPAPVPRLPTKPRLSLGHETRSPLGSMRGLRAASHSGAYSEPPRK